jgi:thiol-disulfide isomerase/thioredoxin
MRASGTALALWLLAGIALVAGPALYAKDKKDDSKPLKIEGELTKDDPVDKAMRNSHHKVHPFKMVAGKAYQIDLMSKDFDAFLRVEDPKGKQVAYDDDGGDGLNSRIFYEADKDGEYKIYATTFPPGQTGKYTLVIAEYDAAKRLAEFKKRLSDFEKQLADRKEKLAVSDVQKAYQFASNVEKAIPKLAPEAYTDLGKILQGSADPKVTEFGKMLEGAGRRVGLPGHELTIQNAATVDGKAVDWNAYRGKVVLVDFWATWCGPCRAELPNVKEMYKKYHDQGFDVLAVSVDANKEALVKFLENEKLPWTCVHDKAKDKAPSLAQYYGVLAIPLPILVDREGKVISMNARGTELQELLAEQFKGAKGKDKASP